MSKQATFVEVTEIDGWLSEPDYECDPRITFGDPDAGFTSHTLGDLTPKECTYNRRGHFRVTIEFVPEESE